MSSTVTVTAKYETPETYELSPDPYCSAVLPRRPKVELTLTYRLGDQGSALSELASAADAIKAEILAGAGGGE